VARPCGVVRRPQAAPAQRWRADRQGRSAVTEASNAVARLRALPADTIIEPRVATGFQTLFDGIDQRVAEIIDTGIDRGAYFERRQVPRLVTGAGQLVSPVRKRFVPLDPGRNKELVDVVRELIPRAPTEPVAPGLSRSILHSALIHRPTRGAIPDGPHI
jgi:hypothetical protein